MITINDFSLDATFTTMYIDYTLDTGDNTTSLKLYIGDRYLSSEFVDLTSLAIGENVHIELDITDPLLTPHYSKEVYDGVFTINIETTLGEVAEAILINAFYASICLANLVIANDTLYEWSEVNMLYMLLQAALIYAGVPQIEQAIGAYSKVEAICASKPVEYQTTAISECGQGLGCWIVDGVYIINK